MRGLAAEIRKGVQQFGIAHTEGFGDIYAYEVDGMGAQLLMDDANTPVCSPSPILAFALPTILFTCAPAPSF